MEPKKPMTMEQEQEEYRKLFGGGGGGGSASNFEEQEPPRQIKKKVMPEWNSDFTEEQSLVKDEPEMPARRQSQDRGGRAPAARQPAAKKKPEWNTEMDQSPFDREQEEYRKQNARPAVQPREQQRQQQQKRPQKEWNTDFDESPLDRQQDDSRRQQQQEPRGGQQGMSKAERDQMMYDQMEQNYKQETRGGGGGQQRQQKGGGGSRQQQQQQQQAPPPAQDWDAPLPTSGGMASPRLNPAAAVKNGAIVGAIPDGADEAPAEQIACNDCGKSFAPATYEKLCKQYNNKGELKCVAMYCKKRKVFNSAKVRIQGNEHLDKDAQKMAIKARVEVVKEKKQAEQGIVKKKVKDDKWKKESEDFRNAMRDNRLMAKAKAEGKPITYYLK
jgi:hypothetical protein